MINFIWFSFSHNELSGILILFNIVYCRSVKDELDVTKELASMNTQYDNFQKVEKTVWEQWCSSITPILGNGHGD